jgi:hypothetical protein
MQTGVKEAVLVNTSLQDRLAFVVVLTWLQISVSKRILGLCGSVPLKLRDIALDAFLTFVNAQDLHRMWWGSYTRARFLYAMDVNTH